MATQSELTSTFSGASASTAPSFASSLRNWLTREHIEVACVVITFVTMIGGLVTANNGSDRLVSSALYLVAYIAGGYFGLTAGLESLRHFTIDVDLLMVLAAIGAVLVGSPFEGAMLLFLFSLSNTLQAYALGRTRNAIRALMKLRPSSALVRRDGQTVSLPIEQLVVGDRIIVRPGERVALDALVIEGESTLDQSSLTGESMPIAKSAGDTIFAGTINQSGSLEAKVTKLATESTIAKLIKMVEEAQNAKAPTERFLDRFEQIYAVVVIAATALLIALPTLIFHEPFDKAFYRAITVMVVASPCALIISTPASILSAIANGARKGILFKGGVHLEQAAHIDVVAFDKTGTLTVGKPSVTDVTIIPMTPHLQALQTLTPESVRNEQENVLLALAAAVESKSEHPLALAIVSTARQRGLNIPDATQFQATTGKGVRAHTPFMGGLDIAVGSPRYFENMNAVGLDTALTEVERLQDEGKTSVLVAKIATDSYLPTAIILGVIAIADSVRPNAKQVVEQLKSLGVKQVVMLTGDNQRVARAMAKQVGVDSYFANLLPEDKVAQIKALREAGKGAGSRNARGNIVAMVGDGVNDAPALASATLGFAMGAAGTDVALETADVVLMADDLSNIAYAISLSRQARKVVLQNLTFAIGVIVVLVLSALGLRLLLPLGVIGHEGSTVLVCLNGLRLLTYRKGTGNT